MEQAYAEWEEWLRAGLGDADAYATEIDRVAQRARPLDREAYRKHFAAARDALEAPAEEMFDRVDRLAAAGRALGEGLALLLDPALKEETENRMSRTYSDNLSLQYRRLEAVAAGVGPRAEAAAGRLAEAAGQPDLAPLEASFLAAPRSGASAHLYALLLRGLPEAGPALQRARLRVLGLDAPPPPPPPLAALADDRPFLQRMGLTFGLRPLGPPAPASGSEVDVIDMTLPGGDVYYDPAPLRDAAAPPATVGISFSLADRLDTVRRGAAAAAGLQEWPEASGPAALRTLDGGRTVQPVGFAPGVDPARVGNGPSPLLLRLNELEGTVVAERRPAYVPAAPAAEALRAAVAEARRSVRAPGGPAATPSAATAAARADLAAALRQPALAGVGRPPLLDGAGGAAREELRLSAFLGARSGAGLSSILARALALREAPGF